MLGAMIHSLAPHRYPRRYIGRHRRLSLRFGAIAAAWRPDQPVT